jgi:hypothetical protein
MSLNVEIDPDLGLESPMLVDLLAYWRGLRAGRRMPSKDDVDPLNIPAPLWPYLELVDVYLGAPPRLRWRLIGTHVTEAVSRDATGSYFEDLYGADDYQTLAMPFNWVIARGQPLRLFGSSSFVDKAWNNYEGIYLPLSDDGESVNTILGGVHYAAISTNRYSTGS